MHTERQEHIDRFYLSRGPCCAGCDWWRSFDVILGDCLRPAPVSNAERWGMTGMASVSICGNHLPPEPGHVVTQRDHHCGDFKDDFDWSSLPLPYLSKIGYGKQKPRKPEPAGS
jgi:hypothetical protein